MAFKPLQELVNESSRDPKMAMMYVNKAKSKNQPVTDESGGYSSAQVGAIKNRLQKSSSKKSSAGPESEDRATKNKVNGY